MKSTPMIAPKTFIRYNPSSGNKGKTYFISNQILEASRRSIADKRYFRIVL
jgi:hypothetical protein